MKVVKSLALTANTQHWPDADVTVFLGKWCEDFNSDYIQNINYELMPSPYKDGDALKNYYCTLDAFERYLPILAQYLNEINKVNLQLRSWRIILGPWLLYYLSALRDRMIHIEHAFKSYDSLKVLILRESDFQTPQDTFSATSSLKQDFFNFQIYSQILALKRFDCDYFSGETQNELLIEQVSRKRLFRLLINKIALFTSKVITPSIFFRHTYFPKKKELFFYTRYLLKFFSSNHVEEALGTKSIDRDSRKRFMNINSVGDEFEVLFKKTLFYNLPLCFIENFQSIINKSEKNYPARSELILSASAWYFDEAFKYWAALNAEKGSLLLGTQHGGGYGSFFTLEEYHELKIVDRYYSWGWKKDSQNVYPIPATKLIGIVERENKSQNTKILWVGTAISRYLLTYPFLPSFNNEYFEWQSRFLKSLDKHLLPFLRHRPHHTSYKNDSLNFLKEAISNLELEDWSVDFNESINKSRVYVCDHNSTTFLEAFALNVPTIMFWNPAHYQLFDNARPFYKSLIDCGILHYSPESAAKLLSEVYETINDWWFETHRQKAVKLFCQNFALRSPNGLNQWKKEFKNLLD